MLKNTANGGNHLRIEKRITVSIHIKIGRIDHIAFYIQTILALISWNLTSVFSRSNHIESSCFTLFRTFILSQKTCLDKSCSPIHTINSDTK